VRPGSLVIGGTKMSKSNSEPMNLITDTALSPGNYFKSSHILFTHKLSTPDISEN